MTRWSRFQSCGQDGFQDLKEDYVEDIRARVRKRHSYATMETLGRMSKADLFVLMFTLQDAEEQCAKALAQADNDKRLAQAREDVSRWPS